MKSLILIRHGDDDENYDDGPLTDRGVMSILSTASQLQSVVTQVNAVLCSPAKRAKETGQTLCTIYNDAFLEEVPWLLETDDLMARVKTLKNQWSSVCLVSHQSPIKRFLRKVHPQASNTLDPNKYGSCVVINFERLGFWNRIGDTMAHEPFTTIYPEGHDLD